MTENASGENVKRLADDLRTIAVFSQLADDQLAWLAEQLEEVRLATTEILNREGDPAEHLFVILEGEIHGYRASTPGAPMFRAFAGQVTGLLPFSRLKNFPATVRAAAPTRLLRLHRDLFPEMMRRMPDLAQGLVAIMAD